ncbi:MAG TPA: metal ABC transporter permease, partial [Arthrobacter sp.]|nr:metal ABC transporter permease [Arthrobacter sp.]
VVGLQAVGIILMVAMLITPGATAFLLTRRFDTMLLIAASITASAAVAGIYASYYLDISTGASVVLAQSVVFVAAYLFARRNGVVWQWQRRRSARRRVSEQPSIPTSV